jgi:hypothetical protein
MDHAIARGLRVRGIDCTTTTDAGLLQAEDEAHIQFCLREQRVIVTNDPDFLVLAHARIQHAGIAYTAREKRSIGYIIRHLCLMSDCLDSAEMVGKVEFL